MSRICAGVMAGLVLAASSAEARDTTLNVDDTSVVPWLRLDIGASGGFAFEPGFSQASGDSSQDLAVGERVSTGGLPLPGPRQISNSGTVRELDGFVRWRSGGNPWMFEVLGGLSAVHYEFNAGGATTSGTPMAAVLGVGGLWRMRPQTSLHARYLLGKGVSSYTDSVKLDRLELSLVQTFARNFAARLGYTVWDVTALPTEPASELHMRFRGPIVGLDILF